MTVTEATDLTPTPTTNTAWLAKVHTVCDELAVDGQAITFGAVASRSGIGRSTLFAHPELQAAIQEHRAGQSPAFASAAHSAAAIRSLPERAATPLRALAEEWITGRCTRGELRGRSPEVMTTQLEGLLRVFGGRHPGELDRKALLDWQATLGRTSPSTRRKYLSTVRQFCRWLVDEEHLDFDPTASLAKVREPRRVPRAMRRSDVAALLQACRTDRELAMVWLMVGCGLRCTEVSGLDLCDYDRDARTVLVRGKGGYERLLPVPAEAAAALETYLAQRGWTAGPLFRATGSKGMPDGRISARWISKSIARRMALAGVHQARDGRTAHALRHTAASDVLDTCRNVRIVQQMLGHTSLQTTQIYLRAANLDDLRAAMEGRDYTPATGGQP